MGMRRRDYITVTEALCGRAGCEGRQVTTMRDVGNVTVSDVNTVIILLWQSGQRKKRERERERERERVCV